MNMTSDAVSALLVANTDIAVASSKIARAIDNPGLRHTLPGLICELSRAHARLRMTVLDVAPPIGAALFLGLKSTEDLHASEVAAAGRLVGAADC